MSYCPKFSQEELEEIAQCDRAHKGTAKRLAGELLEARIEIDWLRERAVIAESDCHDIRKQRDRLLDKMTEYEG